MDKNRSEPADFTIGAMHVAHSFTPHFGAPPRAYEGKYHQFGMWLRILLRLERHELLAG